MMTAMVMRTKKTMTAMMMRTKKTRSERPPHTAEASPSLCVRANLCGRAWALWSCVRVRWHLSCVGAVPLCTGVRVR